MSPIVSAVHRLLAALLLVLITASCPTWAATLTIETARGTTRLASDDLLRRADAATVTIPGDVAYHRTMRYRAVPLAALLKDVAPDDHVQFTALDGFAAEMPAKRVLRPGGAQAWLAIEDTAWPALGPGKPSAGPFYVVWQRPQADGIGPEEWPYQVASIRVVPDQADRFPRMQPAPGLPADDPVRRGLAVFQRNCMACHTLNGQGDARLGPDLNMPHNPMEYLREDMFRLLVRNPQDLRHWPQSRMPGFSRDVLSDGDLDDLVAYLRHMAARRP